MKSRGRADMKDALALVRPQETFEVSVEQSSTPTGQGRPDTESERFRENILSTENI